MTENQKQLITQHKALTDAMHRFNIAYDRVYGHSIDEQTPLKRLFLITPAEVKSEPFEIPGIFEEVADSNPHSPTYGKKIKNQLTPTMQSATVSRTKDPEVKLNEHFWYDKPFPK